MKGIWILWDKGLRILKETTLRKHEILDRFNIFHILVITLSSELRLRWFKLTWKSKRNTYNFHVFICLIFGLHQGQNQLAKVRKFSRMLSTEFWTDLKPFRILAITLSFELRLRWLKMIWEAKRNTYNFYVLCFMRFRLLNGQNWPARGQNFLDQKQNTV